MKSDVFAGSADLDLTAAGYLSYASRHVADIFCMAWSSPQHVANGVIAPISELSFRRTDIRTVLRRTDVRAVF